MPYRVIAGVAILACLAVFDLLRRGRNATRWREHAFLLICVVAAIVYGVVNDQITCAISWEYFYYGKELWPILGPEVPPSPRALRWQAVRIGIEATWSAGLLLGVAMLLANNPSRRGLVRLSYRQLLARLPVLLLLTLACAAAMGAAGRLYLLNWISPDFRDLARSGMWHPRQFMTVYGIHLGGYLGGALAMIYSVWTIRRNRNQLARQGTAQMTAA